MSKSSKRSRRSSRRSETTDRSATTDVVTQLECALRNRRAALLGATIGGLVPWFGRTLAHGEIPDAWSAGQTKIALAMLAVVIGCGIFSGLSVYKFGRAAFGDPRKALGFVLALEGVMLVAHGATSTVALVALVLINAIANGSVIALARDATLRRREADGRRAATRAATRAGNRAVPSIPMTRPTKAPGFSTARPITNAPRAPAVPSQALVPPIVWRRATLDVLDAEILSEERLLS